MNTWKKEKKKIMKTSMPCFSSLPLWDLMRMRLKRQKRWQKLISTLLLPAIALFLDLELN